MTVEAYMMALGLVSTAISLLTEGIKKGFEHYEKQWHGETLASVVSVVVGSFACYAYTMFAHKEITPLLIIEYIIFVGACFVCANIEYDKAAPVIRKLISGVKEWLQTMNL